MNKYFLIQIINIINTWYTLSDYVDRVRPICLPLSDNMLQRSFVGTNPFIAGWGSTSEVSAYLWSFGTNVESILYSKIFYKKGGKSATVLQQAQVPVLDNNSVCKAEYKKIKKLVTPNQFDYTIICAGHLAGGIDTCKGDSGNILFFSCFSFLLFHILAIWPSQYFNSGGPLMLPVQADGMFPFYQIGIVSYGIGKK